MLYEDEKSLPRKKKKKRVKKRKDAPTSIPRPPERKTSANLQNHQSLEAVRNQAELELPPIAKQKEPVNKSIVELELTQSGEVQDFLHMF